MHLRIIWISGFFNKDAKDRREYPAEFAGIVQMGHIWEKLPENEQLFGIWILSSVPYGRLHQPKQDFKIIADIGQSDTFYYNTFFWNDLQQVIVF